MNFLFQLEPREHPSRPMQLASPLLAILITVLTGWAVFSIAGQQPAKAMATFFIAPLSDLNGIAELLLKASPLCLIGLGLSISYRANVWNIGAEGQMLMGGIAASGIALFAPVPSGLMLPVMMLAGIGGGMGWAAIPAYFRTRFNTNEILVTLMLTYVATNILIYLVSGPWRDPMGMNFPLTKQFGPEALVPLLYDDWGWSLWQGTRLNASILLVLPALCLAWLFLAKSFFGFKMSVAGLAPMAARYAGYRENGTVWVALLSSGAFAGLAGVLDVAGPIGQLQSTWSPGYGYTAIIVAFIARLQPVGVALASLMMALLYLGGESIQTSMHVPKSISQVFQGLLLCSLLSCDLLVAYRIRLKKISGGAKAQYSKGSA